MIGYLIVIVPNLNLLVCIIANQCFNSSFWWCHRSEQEYKPFFYDGFPISYRLYALCGLRIIKGWDVSKSAISCCRKFGQCMTHSTARSIPS